MKFWNFPVCELNLRVRRNTPLIAELSSSDILIRIFNEPLYLETCLNCTNPINPSQIIKLCYWKKITALNCLEWIFLLKLGYCPSIVSMSLNQGDLSGWVFGALVYLHESISSTLMKGILRFTFRKKGKFPEVHSTQQKFGNVFVYKARWYSN